MRRLLLLSHGSGHSRAVSANLPCPSSGERQAIERGWTAYRENDIASRGHRVQAEHSLALPEQRRRPHRRWLRRNARGSRCPRLRAFFARAIAADSMSYDAVAGAGMAAYRAGDPVARDAASSGRSELVPGDSTALAYLARLPGQVSQDVLAPSRARPATTTRYGENRQACLRSQERTGQWSPMWIKAVNLGAALPGKHPSEFPPNDSTYEKWIALIADMGANAIRVYTIHPPHFYAAIRNWNLAHRRTPSG